MQLIAYLRRYGAVVVLALLLGIALWMRFGFEPNAGSHRIQVEHIEALALDPGGDATGFTPVDVTVQRPRGTAAWSSDVAAHTWIDDGTGVFRSQPGSGDLIYAGQTSPITWVTWSAGEGGATIRVSVDGQVVDQVEALGPGSGTVPIEFGQSLPPSSLLLLLVLIVWCVPLAAFVVRQFWRMTSGLDRRTLVLQSLALVIGGLVVMQVVPVRPAAVVGYDLVVQPLAQPAERPEPVDVILRVVDVDGRSRLGDPVDIDVGWVAVDDSLSSIGPEPGRWIFMGNPSDRIEVAAPDGQVSVNVVVNGSGTELATDANNPAPVVRSFADLAPPLSAGDRSAVWGARIGDLTLAIVALLLIAALVSRKPRVVDGRRPLVSDEHPRMIRALYLARFALGVWATLLVVLWPGMMNPDSAMQWKALERGVLSDWHPYPMSIVLGVMRWIVDSPWLPISLLALTAGLLVGVAATWAQDAGLPRWCVRMVAWGPAIAPVTAIMTVALWKDVVMGLGVLALVLVLWNTDRSDGAWLSARRRNMAFAVLACLVIWLTRHNGWPIVVGSLLVMVILRPKARRALLVVGLVTTAIALFVRVPLQRALDVEAGPVVAHNYMQRISAHVNSGTHLEPDERAYLSSLRPLDIPWPYDCRTVQTTWFGDDVIPWQDYVDDEAELRDLAVRLAIRNPRVEVAHLTCSTKIVWQITDRGTYTYFLDGYTNAGFANTIPMAQGDLPMEAAPSNSLAVAVYDGFAGLPSPLIRPALYTYVLLGAAGVAARRRRSLGPLLIVSPAIIQTFTLLPFGLVQDTRFQYGTVLVAIVISPILLAESMRSGARATAHGDRDVAPPAASAGPEDQSSC